MSDNETPQPQIKVEIKDRTRLVMAVLAASDWPQHEQSQRTHAVHAHAKETRRFVQPYASHPAVIYANDAIARNVPLSDLFAAALRSTWPELHPYEQMPGPLLDGKWVQLLHEFLRDTAVAERFWSPHRALWDEAVADLADIFAASPLLSYLTTLTQRPLPQTVIVMPNLVFPALQTVLAETKQNLYVIVPPPLAVGESPPWPFREDPPTVQVAVCHALIDHLLADTLANLDDTQAATLLHAITTLFLETAVDEGEAMAYLVRAKKQHKLPTLPLVVENLRQQLSKDQPLDFLKLLT